MAITQRFRPPFAPSDVDTVQFDFAPELMSGETLSNPSVTSSGGFTFGAPFIGAIGTDGNFVAGSQGTVVQALATAGTVLGSFLITFTASTSKNRSLHRTVGADIAIRS